MRAELIIAIYALIFAECGYNTIPTRREIILRNCICDGGLGDYKDIS